METFLNAPRMFSTNCCLIFLPVSLDLHNLGHIINFIYRSGLPYGWSCWQYYRKSERKKHVQWYLHLVSVWRKNFIDHCNMWPSFCTNVIKIFSISVSALIFLLAVHVTKPFELNTWVNCCVFYIYCTINYIFNFASTFMY